MADKIFLMNVLLDLHICPLGKKYASLLPEGTVKCDWLSGIIANSQEMPTELNNGAIAQVRILVEKVIP